MCFSKHALNKRKRTESVEHGVIGPVDSACYMSFIEEQLSRF